MTSLIWLATPRDELRTDRFRLPLDGVCARFGGNARPPKTGSNYPAGFAQYPPSLYSITNGSRGVLLTNLVDQFQFPPESEWNMVFDDASGLTPQCDRPALWKS